MVIQRKSCKSMNRLMFVLLWCIVFLGSKSVCERPREAKSSETIKRSLAAIDEAKYNALRKALRSDVKSLYETTNVLETSAIEDDASKHISFEYPEEILLEKLIDGGRKEHISIIKAQHKRTRRKRFDTIGEHLKRIRKDPNPSASRIHSSVNHEEEEAEDGDDDHDDEQHASHDAHAWKYHGPFGPSGWSAVAADCSADRRRQTPIDIRTSKTKVDETMSDIELLIANPTHGQGITMSNNGHSVNLAFDNSMQVTGGKLGGVYRVAGVHFHWGVSDYTGSEHTINGQRFPLEMHIVSYDQERYSGVAEALKGNDSLAVLGVLFTITDKDNPSIEPIVSNLMAIQFPGSSTRIRHFYLQTLLPNKYQTHFYRYLGSLTTPPCSEVVIWSVFEHTVTISSSQLNYFRELFEGENKQGEPQLLRYNWRPVQSLHQRNVIRSFLHQSVHHHNPPASTSKSPQLVQAAAAPAQDCTVPFSASSMTSNRVHDRLMVLLSSVALFFSIRSSKYLEL